MSEGFFSDTKNTISLLKSVAIMLSIIPPFIGVGFGFVHGTSGVCKSADYTVELMHAIIPFAFLSAPSIFGLIMFFYVYKDDIKSIERALQVLTACAVHGIGNCYGAYCMGKMASVGSVTKAQQKKFYGSYILILIFAEVVALLSLICGIIYYSLDIVPDKK